MLEAVLKVARQAGDVIMEHYGMPVPVEYKQDNSPLTQADKASHHLICEKLKELAPDIPILSEESGKQVTEQRHSWNRFWLVDPLDGTKEFINERGAFTVNIALIEDELPVMGVIYTPAKDLTYYATREDGAYRQEGKEDPQAIQARPIDENSLVVAASRDHRGPALNAFLANLPNEPELQSMGSSLKFCLVGEGKADIYFRDVPTMEWDTAAAQCIVEVTGGSVTDFEGNRLLYNKSSLRNPPLITVGDTSWNWQPYLP